MEFLISFLFFVIAMNSHASGDTSAFHAGMLASFVWFLVGVAND